MTQFTPDPVGKSVPRVDVMEKVTGAAIFADDLPFGPGLTYGRLVRSPHAHALVKRVDVSKALQLRGVKAVVTGQDAPGRIGLYLVDRPIFAADRVRYVGDPVAGVVASSEEIATEAARLVAVDYEELPAVFDPLEAARPDAPLLHPDLGEYKVASFIFPEPGSNISEHFKLRKGDVQAAWPQCAAIVEGTFRLPQIQHVPIEPHVAVALWEPTDQVTLWTCSQSPFAQRDLIAQSLGIPHGNLRVVSPYIGGGFGGKAGVSIEVYAVVMARAVKGHPVKLRLTREEEFVGTVARQSLVAHTKIGCDAQGHLLAMETAYYFGGGAYNDYGVNIARAAGYSCTGPYDIPNVKGDSYCLYTNRPIGSAMRGFGMPEIHWGIEQIMDQLAEEIGIDPAEFRRRNCVLTGDTILTGMKMPAVDLVACIDRVTEAIRWDERGGEGGSEIHPDMRPCAPHKKRGKGIAIMWKAPAMPPNPGSSAIVRFNEDATVNMAIGAQELGQGAFTVLAQIAAQTLGVPYEWVRVSAPVDTRYSPYEWQTVASRITWSTGNAVKAAAADARRQILEIVARRWGEDPDDLDIKDGKVISYRSEQELPLEKTVIYGLPNENFEGWTGGPIVGQGRFMPTYVTNLDFETGQGPRAVVHYTVGAQAVDLEVDTETGEVEILRIASAYDVGKAINPDLIMTQIEGGAVHGMSSAFEEMKFDEQGQPLNASFVDYRIATSVDAPREIHGDIVETPLEDGPWGARGVGEHVMVQTAPAIANALYDALSIRFNDLPLSAEKIFLALQEQEETAS